MAHRLPFHEGGCKNIHGHSYSMLVEIAGEPTPNGMVLDYLVLKDLIDPLIQEIDHSFLCDETDTVVAEFLKKHSMKAVYVDFPTTAENIASWFFDRLSGIFQTYKNVAQLRIRVAETERTYAEVEGLLRFNSADVRHFEHQGHRLE